MRLEDAMIPLYFREACFHEAKVHGFPTIHLPSQQVGPRAESWFQFAHYARKELVLQALATMKLPPWTPHAPVQTQPQEDVHG